MRRLATIAVFATLAAGGCTWGESPARTVTEVSPAQAVRGASVLLTIRGEGFGADSTVDLDARPGGATCAPLRAFLQAPAGTSPPSAAVPIELDRPRVVSSKELRARLLGAADVASAKVAWDLVVVDPRGNAATLAGAVQLGGCATNAPCDDGEPDCTTGDTCNGASFCAGTPVADGTACAFVCTSGSVVAGACAAGVCTPNASLCDPLPACAP